MLADDGSQVDESNGQTAMEHLRPIPRTRKTVSERAQRVISYAWIVASLALPVVGVTMLATSAAPPLDVESASHVVQAGDTMFSIARRYGTTVDVIVQTNGLNDPNLIYVGQVLVIPRAGPGGDGQVYTVQRGDTLALIANRFGQTVDGLAAANNLANPNTIFVGQQLTIPSPAGAQPPAAQPVEQPVISLQPQPEQTLPTYALQRGDSLYRISLIYGVTVDDLLSANSLASPNSIYPGLLLRIPVPAPAVESDPGEAQVSADTSLGTGRSYVVRPGDTLARIAVSFNVTVDGLVAANGLAAPDRIFAGQSLTIPAPGQSARPAPAVTATSHRVQAGETLLAIALRYGVTIHSLAVANNIDNPSRIYAGMVLSIPSAQAGSNSVRYASVGAGLCTDAQPERAGTGYFIRPVRGYQISQYYHALHPGIDLALPTGSPVYAADSGTVVFAGWNTAGYGYLIVLDHGNGWRTYYAHLSSVDVDCGDQVSRGGIIGATGSTGNSTGPHLHFEMLRFGLAINPAGYIRF
jgi:murein DD-endopeptidase MepM/ murein hydrolase activator NlpD